MAVERIYLRSFIEQKDEGSESLSDASQIYTQRHLENWYCNRNRVYFKFRAVASLPCCLPINVSAAPLVVFDSVLCELDFRKNMTIVMDNILSYRCFVIYHKALN